MKNCLRLLTLFVAIAIFAVGSHFMAAAPVIGSLMASDDFRHYAHNQATAVFTSRPIPVTNQSFNDTNVAIFNDGSVPGWTRSETTSGNPLGGTLNMGAFSQFRATHAQTSPSFLSNQPLEVHDNVMALSNRTENATSRVGFYSESITFAADSFYIVAVDFYAIKSNSEIYLRPSDHTEDHLSQLVEERGNSIDIIQASFAPGGVVAENQSVWQTASFFVQTDARESITMQLGLYLGTRDVSSGGVVYYDNASVTQVSQMEFNRRYTEDSARWQRFTSRLDLRQTDEISTDYGITTQNFRSVDTTPVSGTHAQLAVASAIPGLLRFEEVNHLHSFNSRPVGNNVMLLSANSQSAGMRLQTPFNVRRNQVYMISFYTLTGPSGTPNIRVYDTELLNDNRPNTSNPFDSGFISIGGVGVDTRNNWVLNTFFIQGRALYDTPTQIEFWMGTDDTHTTGWIAIDGLSITRVSDAYHTRHREAMSTHNESMNVLTPTPSIYNSGFNFGTVADVNTPFPLRAANWELNYDDADLVISGIVNTEGTHWSRYSSRNGNTAYGRAINPGAIGNLAQNNNIFMMQNVGETRQTLSSNAFALTPTATTQISFDVSTIHERAHGMYFWAVVELDGREVSRINLSRRPMEGNNRQVITPWENFTFGIREGTGSREVRVSFLLGTESRPSNSSIAFIDNVNVTTVAPATTFDSFVNLSDATLFEDAYGNSLSFVTDDPAGIQARVQDGVLSLETRGFRDARAWNTITENLTAGGFYEYRLTLSIYLTHQVVNGQIQYFERKNLGWDEDNNPILEPDDADYGVNISLEGFDGGFMNMKPQYLREMPNAEGGFATLSFFVRSDSALPLALTFSFANDYRMVHAQVAIRSMELVTIDEADFNLAAASLEEDPYNRQIAIMSESDPFEDDGNDDDDTGGFNWGDIDFLLIPSIIMAVALIVALVGFGIRRMKFKKHISKGNTSYARDNAGVTEEEIVSLKSKRAPKEK